MGLRKYKNRQVVASKMSLTNAGDGLSESMRIEPLDLDFGHKVLVVIEATVMKHTHQPAMKDDPYGPLELVTVLKASAATVVTDDPAVQAIIDEHKAKVQASHEIEGQRSIDDEANGE